MPSQLMPRAPDLAAFETGPLARMKYAPRRRASSRLRLEDEQTARDEVGRSPHLCHPVEELPGEEHRPDTAAVLAQAEADDLALVRLASNRLAAALREVYVLLGRGWSHAAKLEALRRCEAKGWIVVLGDGFSELQTFRVTADGYRAAGLRMPFYSA